MSVSGALLQVRNLDLDTVDGRPLLRSLSMDLGRDKVALVGRNGVGKSTLLEALAEGPEVRRRGAVARVPQDLAEPCEASPGERRRHALAEAFGSGADVLLLDEPTEDLDADGRDWLLEAVGAWTGGLIVVSHDTELLSRLGHFFVMEESGCHLVSGTLDDLLASRREAARQAQERYAQTLNVLGQQIDRDRRVRQRRRRKKAVGRLHEIDRNQSRMRLNNRRAAAQVSQGRLRAIADDRLDEKVRWAASVRRALQVALPLTDVVPEPAQGEGPAILAEGLAVAIGGRVLAEGLDVRVTRERVAVTGPNGAGKTTLLETLCRDRPPHAGRVLTDLLRVGTIAQGAVDWQLDESLLDVLARFADVDEVAARLVAHRFPLPLADRPLATLSPGERTRAALIALFQRPALEVLVLDEPTRSLDLDGADALTEALVAWRGGLVVVSHDRPFLRALGIDRHIAL